MAYPGTAVPQQVTPLQKVAFSLLLVSMFFLYSRVFDLALSSLHITAAVFVITAGAALFLAGFRRAFAHRIGILLALLNLWFVVSTPFSVWKGGSVGVLRGAAVHFGVYFITAGLILSYDQFRKVIHVLAYAILVLAILTVPFGKDMDGRIHPAQGEFANPNDFAQVILLSLPLWFYLARRPARTPLWRPFAAASMLFLLWMMANTGSRGAFLGLVATGLLFVLKTPMRIKLALAAGVPVLLLVLALLLPENLRTRYITFFDAEPDPTTELEARLTEAAVSSTAARLELLKQSVTLTLQNPLVGVGPGMFEVAQADWAEDTGERARWQTPHNTYTQLSSETGIPALLIYLGLLVSCFLTVRLPALSAVARYPQFKDISNAATSLKLSLVAFAVSAFFSSFAYAIFVPTLAGLIVALEGTAATELAKWQGSEPARPPVVQRRALAGKSSVLPAVAAAASADFGKKIPRGA